MEALLDKYNGRAEEKSHLQLFVDALVNWQHKQGDDQNSSVAILRKYSERLTPKEKVNFYHRHSEQIWRNLSSIDTSRHNINTLDGSHQLKQSLFLALEIWNAWDRVPISRPDHLLSSRDVVLRIVGLELINQSLEGKRSGSSDISEDLWKKVFRVCLDDYECAQARSLAFQCAGKLVMDKMPSAPKCVEPVSGMATNSICIFVDVCFLCKIMNPSWGIILFCFIHSSNSLLSGFDPLRHWLLMELIVWTALGVLHLVW